MEENFDEKSGRVVGDSGWSCGLTLVITQGLKSRKLDEKFDYSFRSPNRWIFYYACMMSSEIRKKRYLNITFN